MGGDLRRVLLELFSSRSRFLLLECVLVRNGRGRIGGRGETETVNLCTMLSL